ncbi:hypothetical protein BGX21_006706 [Mortierella sp. AD011]|nr:hypothetical protein BGX20_010660 [Mortierella sp. AD010]KAF9399165.1 hypothetical protein BGX21_006706 [Mortierella sp. AD011]
MKFSTIFLLPATTAIAFASQSCSQRYARDCLVECGFHKLAADGPAATSGLGALGEILGSKSSLKKRGNLIKFLPHPRNVRGLSTRSCESCDHAGKDDNNGNDNSDEGNNNNSGDRHQEQRQDSHRSSHHGRHGHSLDATIGLKVNILAKTYINIHVNALLDIKAVDLGAGTLTYLHVHLNALRSRLMWSLPWDWISVPRLEMSSLLP